MWLITSDEPVILIDDAKERAKRLVQLKCKNFAINFGVKEVNTLKLGMGGSLTLIMLSLTPPAVTTTIKVKEAS